MQEARMSKGATINPENQNIHKENNVYIKLITIYLSIAKIQ